MAEDTHTAPEHGWTCFHCGETFMDEGQARIHFGEDQGATPGCLMRLQPGEHGMLRKMRAMEKELHTVTFQLFEQDSETDRYLANIQAAHASAVTKAEETGYAKGLRDAGAWRARRIAEWAEDTFGPATPLSTTIRALRELLELAELLTPSELSLAASIRIMQQTANSCQHWEAEHRSIIPINLEDGYKAMEEVADVRIVLARIHRFYAGVPEDEQAQDIKMDINVKRTWKLDGHGHGQHVTEPSPERSSPVPCPACGSIRSNFDCSECMPF